MNSKPIIIAGVTLSLAAAQNVEETGVDVAADLDSLRSGLLTSAALLDACLDGAADDREQGWRDYVSALSAHLAAEGSVAPIVVREFSTMPELALEGWNPNALSGGDYSTDRARALYAALGVSESDEEYALARHSDGRWALFGLTVEGHRYAEEAPAEEPAPALDPLAATLVVWTGSAEQIDALRAVARDFEWSDAAIADAEHAADEVVSALVANIEPHPEALARLRGYLVESAERCAAPAGDRSPVLVDGLADLRTWIANNDPCGAISGLGDVTAEERGAAVGQLAAAIREEDHPAWGSDWGPWLAEHAERITGEWLATGAR